MSRFYCTARHAHRSHSAAQKCPAGCGCGCSVSVPVREPWLVRRYGGKAQVRRMRDGRLTVTLLGASRMTAEQGRRAMRWVMEEGQK